MTNSDTALFEREEDRYAGFISRAIGFLIDVFIILIVNAMINFMIRVLLTFFGIDNQKVISDISATRLANGLALIFPVFLQAAYFIGCWSIFGRTVGMSLLGIRIEETNRPGDVTFIRATLRYIGYYVSLLALGIGFLWVLVDKRSQGWMDKMGNTYVVYSGTAVRYHKKRLAAQQNSQKSEAIAARLSKFL